MIGEFGIIERYFTRATHDQDVVVGIGDDAAVLAVGGLAAITVDTLVAGVHFPDRMAPSLLGYRSMAVNLSDLAAMGAQPRWCTLALTLPSSDETWLEGFARGFFELAEKFGVSLVGGDLTRGPLTVTVQLMGRVERERMLTRNGGILGDDVYVTGTLGDSAGGLALRERSLERATSAAAQAFARAFLPAAAANRGKAGATLPREHGQSISPMGC